MASHSSALPSYPYRADRGYLALVVAVVLGFLLMFWSTVGSMVAIWDRSETFAHGFLIAPIALWLIWRRRDALATLPPTPNLKVLPLLMVIGSGWLMAHAADVLVIEQLAFVTMLITVVWALLGNRLVWALIFPLTFLIAAVPMGEALIPPLMDFTADFTVKMLQLTGIPVFREGNFFEIPSGQWSVVEGCSGLRYLIASITLGVLYAYLTYRSLLRRTLFIIAAVLVPVLANGFRAYLIVMIGHLSNMKLATGVDHLVYGWVFFGVVMLLLFWLGSFWREDDKPGFYASPRARYHTNAPPLSLNRLAATAVIVLAIAGTAPALAYYLDRDNGQTAHIEMATPAPTSAWQLAEKPAWDWVPDFVGMTATRYQAYQRNGADVAIWLGYYRDQHRGAQLVTSNNMMIHQKHPVWGQVGERKISVTIAGQPVEIRQTQLRSPGQHLLIWDWYWIGDRYTSNPYLAKLLEAKARLTGGTRHAAEIIIATRYDDKIEPAAEVLRSALQDLLPSIEATLRDAKRQP